MLRAYEHVTCGTFPCTDVKKDIHILPSMDLKPEAIKIMMICEAPPSDPEDRFYAGQGSFYLSTVLQAFQDSGVNVSSMEDIAKAGVYLTTAVKCAKTGYQVSTDSIRNCSFLLEKEIALFPNVEVYLFMGDVAIKAANQISRRQTGKAAIPAGSTYKIRRQAFYFQGKRAFPSYTPTGHNYLIEKSKRRMIAEDIRATMEIIARNPRA